MIRTRQTLTRLAAGLGALAVLAILLVAVPWALAHYVGWPLPHTIPTWTSIQTGLTAHGIPTADLINALALVVWVGWALLAATVATEVAAVAGAVGRPVRHVPLAGALHPFARALVTAVLIGLVGTLPKPAPGPASGPVSGPSLGGRPALAASLAATQQHQPNPNSVLLGASLPATTLTAISKPLASAASTTTGPRLRPYVVQRRDTLWGIADTQLGDPHRWPEIFALNQGRQQPGGQALTDANRIWPGWTLLLPTTTSRTAAEPSTTAPSTAEPANSAQSTAAPLTVGPLHGVPSAALPSSAPTSTPASAPSSAGSPRPAVPTAESGLRQPAAATPPSPTPRLPGPEEPASRSPLVAPNSPSGSDSDDSSPNVDGVRGSVPSADTPPRSSPPPGMSISLTSGSEVGAGLAAAVLAAVGAARLRRRRQYRPASPGPARYTTSLPPTPLRDLLRRPDPDDKPAAEATAPRHASSPASSHALNAALDAVEADCTASPACRNDDQADRAATGNSPNSLPNSLPNPWADPSLTPATPTSTTEGTEVGTRGGKPIRLRLTGTGGLTLTGPGARATARAWLSALVADAGPFGVRIYTTRDLADDLLPGMDASPAIRLVPSAHTLRQYIDREILARGRTLAAASTEEGTLIEAATYRERNPEDPLPPVLAIATTEDADDRWPAALQAASALDIGALFIHDTNTSNRLPHAVSTSVDVDQDGIVRRATGAAQTLSGARLFRLSRPDAAALLAPIAADHASRSASPSPLDTLRARRGDGRLDGRLEDPNQLTGPPIGWPVHEPLQPTGTVTVARPTSAVAEDSPTPGDTEQVAEDRREPAIRVQMLGPYRIWAHGEEITTGLRSSARDLLAWYLLRPDGATADTAIEAFWPDLDPDRGRQRFWNALGNLRSRLRAGDGAPGLDVLVKAAGRYRPQVEELDVDVWRFQQALTDASAADPTAIRQALTIATALFRADLLDGDDQPWVEPLREELHRRALDGYLRLAELEAAADEPDRALDTLEHAITLDPLAEEAYRRILTIQGSLRRYDAARRTWTLLRQRLADLGLDPEQETTALYRVVRSAVARIGEPALRGP